MNTSKTGSREIEANMTKVEKKRHQKFGHIFNSIFEREKSVENS